MSVARDVWLLPPIPKHTMSSPNGKQQQQQQQQRRHGGGGGGGGGGNNRNNSGGGGHKSGGGGGSSSREPRGRPGNQNHHHQDAPLADPELVASLAEMGLLDAGSDGLDVAALQTYDRKGARSLNHLLNFSFPQRERESHPPPARSSRSNNRKPVRYSPHNKERYVHANFRFVVNPKGAYDVNLGDPDVPVSWDAVDQVIMTTHTEPCCPICLDKPSAAQVTKCGHVFCWVCVLRYLSLGEKKWRRCPICFESVYADDLRPASVQRVSYFHEGVSIRLNLMKRAKDEFVSAPIDAWFEGMGESVPLKYAQRASEVYTKLQRSTPAIQQQLCLREAHDLMVVYLDAVTGGDVDTLPYIKDAMSALAKRSLSADFFDLPQRLSPYIDGAIRTPSQAIKALETLEASRPPPSPSLVPFEATMASSIASKSSSAPPQDVASSPPISIGNGHWKPFSEVQADLGGAGLAASPEQLHEAAFSSASEDDDNNSEDDEGDLFGSPDLGEFKLRSSAPSSATTKHRPSSNYPAEDAFYFFQAHDGQQIYLHPVNVRMLREEFGSYVNFPQAIEGKIVEVEEISQSDESRRRHKALEHLPLSCEFVLVELDLSHAGLFSKRTLGLFAEELRQRERRRRQKVRKENDLSAKIEESNAAKQAETLAREYPSLSWANRQSNPVVLPVGDEWGPPPSSSVVVPASPPLAPIGVSNPSASYARVATSLMSDVVANPPLAPSSHHSKAPSWASLSRSPPPAATSSSASPTKTMDIMPSLDLGESADSASHSGSAPSSSSAAKKGSPKKKQQQVLMSTSFRRY